MKVTEWFGRAGAVSQASDSAFGTPRSTGFWYRQTSWNCVESLVTVSV
ncbi:hypothetical protein [Streptomyces sp. NPDC058548]